MRKEGTFVDQMVTSFRRRFPTAGRGFYTSYLNLKYDIYSNVLRNPRSRREFERQSPVLSREQQRVVRDLSTRGIASIHFAELGIDREQWNRLRQVVDEFTNNANQLLHGRDNNDVLDSSAPDAFQRNRERMREFLTLRDKAGGDAYLLKLYPEQPTFNVSDPLLQIGLGAPVLNVVNAYLGMWARLTYTDVWHTIPVDVGQRVGSQRWHRDSEDRKMVKVYLYFSEVNEGTGPLQYVPGSGVGGPYEDLGRWKAAGREPVSEAELERRIPASEWVTGTGEPGTIIFCDTSGLHRGGIAITGSRIAATWTFVTPASLFLRRFNVKYDGSEGGMKLSETAKFALADPRPSLP